MKKYIIETSVIHKISFDSNYCLLKLSADTPFPDMLPGQFVQIRTENSANVFLRRPVSVNFFDKENNLLWLLVQIIGNGTRALANYRTGERLNIMAPLGNHFTLAPTQSNNADQPLLAGGGVGTAPLLYLGAYLKDNGYKPVFLLGAKSKHDLVQLDNFHEIGEVHVTTEDGSCGIKGYLTRHPILNERNFSHIYTCGPKPMMMAVAKYAVDMSITCEVSLENTMACGIGACLCCVENTVEGNKCICTEGPVFNINKLKWPI
jgi:dihydroorotate dehydrogenase electron transfer subunit